MAFVDALAGAALLGFLHTPESNVLMLAVSALLVVLAGTLLLLSSTSAAHGLVHARRRGRASGPRHGTCRWYSSPIGARPVVRRRGMVRVVVDGTCG